jgi:chitodextrinase
MAAFQAMLALFEAALAGFQAGEPGGVWSLWVILSARSGGGGGSGRAHEPSCGAGNVIVFGSVNASMG